MLKRRISHILHDETVAGGFLIISAILALGFSNSSFAPHYDNFFNVPLFGVHTLHYWVNHALMAIFFLTVGLEVKEQLLFGDLSSIKKSTLPGMAALGGMCIPALVFLGVNWHHPQYWHGWGIPIATDIAFSLAVLKMLGNRIPHTLKYFLLALATFDDIGAVAVIAIFYTPTIHLGMFLVAVLLLVILCVLNYYCFRWISAYMILGFFLWFFLSKSGVDGAITGVLLAFTLPLKDQFSYIRKWHKKLIPWNNTLILPLFALSNVGIYFNQVDIVSLYSPLPLGILLGLVVGKPLGIMFFSWIAIRLRWAQLPDNVDWSSLMGIALICGIGFTISFLVGELAFRDPMFDLRDEIKVSILTASFLSAILSMVWFKLRTKYVRK